MYYDPLTFSEEIISEYKYPEYETYSGSSQRSEFKFRTVKGLTLAIGWLMEELILAKCKLADVTPLYAILKAKQIKESWLDYITTEYTLILHYHESPAVASLILTIAAALTAAGFLVLSYNATPETWSSIAKIPEAVAEIPKQISNTLLFAGLILLILLFK